jgi:hypothetical protein
MMVFAILAPKPETKLNLAIIQEFPDNFIAIGSGQWFVAGNGTAKDVSDRLGITSGENGSAIVVTVGGYYGRAATNIWEWVAAKLNEPSPPPKAS